MLRPILWKTVFVAVVLLLIFDGVNAQHDVASTAGVNTIPVAEIKTFEPNPSTVTQGDPVTFSWNITNTGNVPIPKANQNLSLVIYNSEEVFNKTYDPKSLPVGGSYEISGEWSTSGVSPGTYTANLSLFYNNESDSKEVTVKVKSPPVEEPPVGGGAPGAEVFPFPIPTPILPPEEGELKFRDDEAVLIEIRPGDTEVTDLHVWNPTDEDLDVTASTAFSEEWVYLKPKKFTLDKNDARALNIVVSAPLDAKVGMYKVVVRVSSGSISGETFLILRVKNYPPGYDLPSVTRVISVNRETKATDVSLYVKGGSRLAEMVEIIEEIPKVLATSTSSVMFDVQPEIIEDDPVVKWTVEDVAPNDTRTIFYRIPKVLEEYSPYVYWPIRQVTVIEEVSEPLKITEIGSKPVVPGEYADISIQVLNQGVEAIDIKVTIEIPSEWDLTPSEITTSIQPGKTEKLVFQVKPPANATAGTQIVTLILSYDDDTIIREISLPISEPTFLPLPPGLAGVLPVSPHVLLILILTLTGAMLIITTILVRRYRKTHRDEFVRRIRRIK